MEKPTAVLMIVSGVTKDRARMAAYSKALASSGLYEEAGGYYLNNPRAITVFEGELPKDHATLVVRFPSLEAAQSFWNSPVYQNEIKPKRENPSAGDYSVVVYQETDPPDYIRHGGTELCKKQQTDQ